MVFRKAAFISSTALFHQCSSCTSTLLIDQGVDLILDGTRPLFLLLAQPPFQPLPPSAALCPQIQPRHPANLEAGRPPNAYHIPTTGHGACASACTATHTLITRPGCLDSRILLPSCQVPKWILGRAHCKLAGPLACITVGPNEKLKHHARSQGPRHIAKQSNHKFVKSSQTTQQKFFS